MGDKTPVSPMSQLLKEDSLLAVVDPQEMKDCLTEASLAEIQVGKHMHLLFLYILPFILFSCMMYGIRHQADPPSN